MAPDFARYARAIIANAKALAGAMAEKGWRIVSRRHGQPPDADRPAQAAGRCHRPPGGQLAGDGGHSRQQEPDSLRLPPADRDIRHTPGHAGGDPRAAWAQMKWAR